jgi:hypothetical protein
MVAEFPTDGFLPVIEVHLAETVGLDPADINTELGLAPPVQA